MSDKRFAEILTESVILLDNNHRLLWWNTPAKNLFALDKQYENKPIEYAITEKNLLDYIKSPTTKSSEKKTIELTLHNKKRVHLLINKTNYDGDKCLLIIQDITHTHLLEQIRQDFIANVSHELRTPLTVFQGYLEILLDQKNPVDDLLSIYQQMADQSLRMQNLVEDLLLLSRLESVEPNKENYILIDVCRMIEKIVLDAKSLSAQQQHQFSVNADKELKFYGDSSELYSAFSNLVFNAVRYTPEKGHITIEWFQKNDIAYFTVIDTGIGIAEKHLDKLTQRFYRVDRARSRAKGGTGLGLAIVKHVLLRHGGELLIRSAIRKGSEFSCLLPIIPSEK